MSVAKDEGASTRRQAPPVAPARRAAPRHPPGPAKRKLWPSKMDASDPQKHPTKLDPQHCARE
eukprot:6008055-Alexandrium_andersonii.AAC.1